MNLILGHKIVKTKEGNIYILFLNQQLNEFAEEFNEVGKNNYKLEENLQNQIKKYINKNLPDLKIKTVNIMIGSLLIASIPFANLNVVKAEKNSLINESQVKSFITYTVKKGDTLFKIANRYNVTVNEIKSLNKLNTTYIYPGDKLKIPRKNYGFYNVVKGDTLYKISRLFNISIANLKITNNLEKNTIFTRQRLYIPDKNTLSLVNDLPKGILNFQSKGIDVLKVQKALNSLGYGLNEDGNYNQTTKKIITDFQSQYKNLVNDGIYGPNTKKTLKKALLTDHFIVSNPRDVLVLVNKNYSLDSTYFPENLIVPNVLFPFKEYHQKKLMRQDAAYALEKLFKKAESEGVKLYALSGFRSFDRQRVIFSSKAMRMGIKKANEYSAKPGESEHQTGLSMDVTSKSVNFGLSQYFGETKEGKWLKKNAYKFGFIIRYQRGKKHITGYNYEPWHIRYVGKGPARIITNNNLTLEEYLKK
ncbi:MAG: LysM peptidoglycan-binding domain-containing protein [Firmicutes bacterium]|nr:LysM peptidoglycan-binding domain-containing protein [Bacillota bacterium]